MSRLLLVRHGVTEFNSNQRFMGYTDIDMNTVGYSQIEKLRDLLVDEKVSSIYSSDLKRAMSTADVISSSCNTDVVPCTDLREINCGDVEGLTFEEISNKYPELAGMITNFNLKIKFPGGESFEDFIERTSQFLDKLKEHDSSDTIIIVSHSGVLRVLVCLLLGIDMNCWWQFRFDNASLSVVETYPQGAVINLLNGTSHL
ncbi:histidine phosphatase family protein [Chloroflexota bacterium]